MATALTPAGAGGVYVGGQSSVPASQAQVSFVARLTAGLKPNGLAILTGTAKHQVAALAALPGADLLIGGNFREAYAPQPTPMQGLFGRRPDVLEERQDTGAAIERIEAAGHDDGYLTRWHWPE
jgi:hypothetical protein